ncbi:major histocompatibility complex class I-related gene protein-like isoform X2 [Xiphophorus hellerii]|uniref:major histocompatibility complex class I-related gene protein-like isoform X2 n=1 Tax=Xiphophorus hellerii TaxID=8084 RepID=UPI0013B3C8C5|nr:major histocompatibility complex class I-related gene protein-like isoform X2 [Xiphophorus hellerii]
MKRLFIFLLICHIASLEPHSLWYILSATTGISDFPEFLGSGVVDGVVVGYCDNSLKYTIPKTHWMSKLFEEDPQHVQWLNNKCLLNRLDFKATIITLKQRFNQSEAVHIFQRSNGCFWDDETGEFDGFNEYGYDGEDLIRFDLKTLTWISPRRQTVINKHNWDSDGNNLFWKHALTEDCLRFLKLYLNYGKSSLQTTVHPSVSLLQKSPSSAVTCHATGFYPERAAVFWRKDGQELHEGVEKGEILPNNDGTFQMSVDLNISPPEDWARYDCVFQFTGAEDKILIKLDKEVIKTNRDESSQIRIIVIAVVSVAIAIIIIIALAFTAYKKRNVSERPLTPDSENMSL